MNFDSNQMSIANKAANNQKIKLVFVITALGTGGAEMMLYKLLTRINRDRYSPTVISLIDGGVFIGRFYDLDIPVKTLGMKPGVYNPIILLKLRQMLREIQPDIIQGWMYHANLAAQLSNFLALGKASVFWSIHHSVDSLKAEKLPLAATIKLTALLSSKVEKVIFSAEKGQKQHIQLGYDPTNGAAIGDNFDLAKYKPASNPQFNLRSSLGLPEDSILIGSVARYHPMKDHANLIEGAAILIANDPKVHFVLVGPNVDQQNPALSAQIAKLGIADQVHLLGERQDIPDVMTSFDIFTTSSAYGESFPNVLGEAMSCQIPCVATDIGDSRTVIGDTGVVVPPKDPQALADAWQKLIILGQEKRQDLGKQARQRIQDNFNLDGDNSFVRQYESLYEISLAK
jgi:glycosyltransferase involved in cell wall biosynthesis